MTTHIDMCWRTILVWTRSKSRHWTRSWDHSAGWALKLAWACQQVVNVNGVHTDLELSPGIYLKRCNDSTDHLYLQKHVFRSVDICNNMIDNGQWTTDNYTIQLKSSTVADSLLVRRTDQVTYFNTTVNRHARINVYDSIQCRLQSYGRLIHGHG